MRSTLKIILLTCVTLCLTAGTSGQDPSPGKWHFNGYLKDLQMISYDDFRKEWYLNNEINSRLNLKWYPTDPLIVEAGMRIRFLFGNYIQLMQYQYPDYIKTMDQDPGFLDLTMVVDDADSYVLLAGLDRLNLKYSVNQWEFNLGRQRINWGINYIWTPNDIFNSFSYFDFDYEERPGCDALQIEYYTGMASSVQLAASLNHDRRLTAAGMYRFNMREYDFQVMAGQMVNDLVIGGGWSGDIGGGGFRGEFTYFRSAENFSDTTGQLVAALDGDYTFKKGIYLHASALYNSTGTTGKAGGNTMLDMRNISVKDFTRARYSLFGEIAYPVTPLVRADLAGIYNPCDDSFFIGPSVDISLTDNLYLLLIAQLFYGADGTEYGDYGKFWYLRLKWSF
ncbi:MAG: hypothetical protein PHD61_02380 [Bacteroidales bacterium]|nr:hypothetical protein [Lentimicrobiaceae bacterium]MDD5694135.1 hypothetical protein [Bacteroidales bacterium]